VHSLPSALVPALAGTGLNFVVFGTVGFSVVISILFLVTRGSDSMYDQIGAGGISREGDYGGSAPSGPPANSPAALVEQEREIRQMLKARSDRLVRNGESALDIDAEVARLLAPANSPGRQDAELLAEVRELVVARNERRVRKGMEPLDVDAEIERTLGEMEP
jgi:hypothetical protein